jgi:hypothetical protein
VTFIAPSAAFRRHHRHRKRREAIHKSPARLDRFAAVSHTTGAGLQAALKGRLSHPQPHISIFSIFFNRIQSYPQDD